MKMDVISKVSAKFTKDSEDPEQGNVALDLEDLPKDVTEITDDEAKKACSGLRLFLMVSHGFY
jgi:hypothetical protein